MLALKKGTIKKHNFKKENKTTKNESVQKQNTQKIQKEIQIRRHLTHDGLESLWYKNYNQGLLKITCLIKKTPESRKKERKMNNLSIRDFLCFNSSAFLPPKTEISWNCDEGTVTHNNFTRFLEIKKSANWMPHLCRLASIIFSLHDRLEFFQNFWFKKK